MVWIITGNLNSKASDDDQTPPSPTSHYLRPTRTYRLGRASWDATNQKDGKIMHVRDKLYDFRVKSLGISGTGQWEIRCGTWEEDDVTSSDGTARYSLHYKQLTTKGFTLIRNGVTEKRDSNELELEHGDEVAFTGSGSMRFTVEWVPYNINFALPQAEFPSLLLQAKSFGCQLTQSPSPLNSIHTHYIIPLIRPTLNPPLASLLSIHLVNQSFVQKLFKSANPPNPFPNLDELPLLKSTSWNSNSKEKEKKEKEINSVDEKVLIEFNKDIGRDFKNFFGHCDFENDWDLNKVKEEVEGFRSEVSGEREDEWVKGGWGRRVERREIFKGVTVCSWAEEGIDQEVERTLVENGAGRYFLVESKSKERKTAEEVIRALVEFEENEDIREESEDDCRRRYVILPPEGIQLEWKVGEKGESKVVREVARRLQVTCYQERGSLDLIQTIYLVDQEYLFNKGPEFDERHYLNGPPPTATGRFTLPPSSGIPLPSLTPAFGPTPTPTPTPSGAGGSTFQSVAGTHPEEETIQPVGKRKLTRRNRTQRTTAEDGGEDDENSFQMMLDGGYTRDVQTQAEVNELMESSMTATMTKPKLKRRAGRTQAIRQEEGEGEGEGGSDVDDSQTSGAGGPASSSYDYNLDEDGEGGRPKKRLRVEGEGDESSQSQALPLRGKENGKGNGKEDLSVVREEEEEDPTPSTSNTIRKKRVASEAVSDGEGPATTKRKTQAQVEPVVVVTSNKTAPSKKSAAAVTKGGKKGAKGKDKEKDKEMTDDAPLLRMKTIKRKGAEVDQGFNEEFNALKIVKPTYLAMKPPVRTKIGWGDNDVDEERNRLIREDQERGDHPDDWVAPEKSFFVVEFVSMRDKERVAPRIEVDVDPRWAGRPNFKKFRPKGVKVAPAAARKPIVLVAPDILDLGMGAAYAPTVKRGGTHSQQASQAYKRESESDEDDDDEMRSNAGGQTKLNFSKAKAKPAPKGKGKAPAKGKKGAPIDSELDSDNSDQLGSSGTLRQDSMDVDSDDEDRSQTLASSSRAKPAAKGGSKAKAPAKPKPKAAPAKRKAVETLVIDTDSESDSGLTFKGFGGKRKR